MRPRLLVKPWWGGAQARGSTTELHEVTPCQGLADQARGGWGLPHTTAPRQPPEVDGRRVPGAGRAAEASTLSSWHTRSGTRGRFHDSKPVQTT